MNITQLKYVLEIAGSSSMREAASKLYVTQPALSASIRELEEELGILIFERTNKGISLTGAGREFLVYAKKAVGQYEILEDRYLSKDMDKEKPLDLGADFVVEALTKFINGHGDAQGGAIISNDLTTMDRIRYEAQVNVGSVISPFNAWQIFRGSVTFPLRMQRINESSQKIAEWLEQRDNITFVSYPGLHGNSGYEIAKKQMKNGYGGVISFGVNTDDKTVEKFCAALNIVTFAVSLGHDESLIFPQPSYDERIHLYPEKFRKGFIRFSVGLEDADDIIADLDQALRSIDL